MRCSAIARSGDQCRRDAVRGADKCASHLGLSGRKTHLTPELTAQLTAMLRAGNYLQVALTAVSLPRRTFHEWMQRGQSDEPAEALYHDFRERVEQARAAAEVRHVAAISAAAPTTWAAAAWLLERQYPERWGRPSQRDKDDAHSSDESTTPDPFAEVDQLAERRAQREH